MIPSPDYQWRHRTMPGDPSPLLIDSVLLSAFALHLARIVVQLVALPFVRTRRRGRRTAVLTTYLVASWVAFTAPERLALNASVGALQPGTLATAAHGLPEAMPLRAALVMLAMSTVYLWWKRHPQWKR